MEPIGKCEYMDSIDIHYIYINQLSQIDKLVTDKHTFDKCSDSNVLTKELLIKYVQNKRDTGIRYKLKDILVYLVKLEPGSVQEFSQAVHLEPYIDTFLKPLPILDDISFDPTMYMFHNINSIFIIFQEPIVPTSILKNGASKKSTKKVRISPDISVVNESSNNKTHKQRET